MRSVCRSSVGGGSIGGGGKSNAVSNDSGSYAGGWEKGGTHNNVRFIIKKKKQAHKQSESRHRRMIDRDRWPS